jgi:hypothetical protein
MGLALGIEVCQRVHCGWAARQAITIYVPFIELKHHTAMINWNERLRAAGIHLGICLPIAALAALLVFGIWYPYPYREISGGRELFLIVVAVDVILGPLITLAVFNRAKPWTELRRDLATVGVIQLAGLGYGLWTVAVARPVHLVFEIDRFRAVHAIDVPEDLVGRQPAGVTALPWLGPTLLSVRPFRDSSEGFEATVAALKGVQIGARPDFWQSYGEGRAQVLHAAKPVTQLRDRFATRREEIDAVLKDKGRSAESVAYVPLISRKFFWTALVDARTADVIAFVPVDPL